ncbi:MAG: chorismate mutase [Fusobacteriaceae bacterium]
MENLLLELRKKIDEVDTKILTLIEERTKYVKEVGKLKGKNNSKIYAPEREEEIFNKLSQESNVISYEKIRAVFTEIISVCRDLEKRFKVFCIGEKSEFVALKIFGTYVNIQNISAEEEINFDYDFILCNSKINLLENLKSSHHILSEINFGNYNFFLLEKAREGNTSKNYVANKINLTQNL